MFAIAIREQEIEDIFGSFTMCTIHASTFVVEVDFNVDSLGIWYPTLIRAILGRVFESAIRMAILCIRTVDKTTPVGCARLVTLEVKYCARNRRDVHVPFSSMLIFITWDGHD